MAKATTHIETQQPDTVAAEQQAVQELLAAMAKNKDSLLLLMDVVKQLHEAGLLEMADAFLKNRHQIGVIGLHQLNKSGAQRIIKNSMGALGFLSKLDPDKLGTMLGAVASGVDRATEAQQEHKQMGVWGMVKTMRDPEVQTSVGVLMNFLRGMGNGLDKNVH